MLREFVRIDGALADLVPIFRTGGVVVSAKGEVVVAQPQDFRVLFFDSTGAQVGSFGGRGSGPGEFLDISRLGWRGDSLWVWDRILARVVMISPDRVSSRTFNVPSAAKASRDGNVEHFPIVLPRAFYHGEGLVAVIMSQETAQLVRMSVSGQVEVILGELFSTSDANSVAVDGYVVDARPYPSSPIEAVSANGEHVAIIRTHMAAAEHSIEIAILTPVADTVLARRFPFQGRRISARAADSTVRARTAHLPPSVAAAYRRTAVIPNVYPPVIGATIGDDALLALELRNGEERGDYVVVDQRGDVVGRFALPPMAVLVALHSTFILTVERDADDVPSIVGYLLSN